MKIYENFFLSIVICVVDHQVASLEERVVGRSDMEREKDEEFVKNRKLLKLVDKYKAELSERIAEVQDLKARLLESSDIRVSRLSPHARSLTCTRN